MRFWLAKQTMSTTHLKKQRKIKKDEDRQALLYWLRDTNE